MPVGISGNPGGKLLNLPPILLPSRGLSILNLRVRQAKTHLAFENHAEDIRLSTLEKFATSVGRKLEVKLA